MTIKIKDIKEFDDEVNILLSGGEIYSLKIVGTDKDTIFLEPYMEKL